MFGMVLSLAPQSGVPATVRSSKWNPLSRGGFVGAQQKKYIQKAMKNQPKIDQKSIKNRSKIHQKSILEASWGLLGGLEGLEGILGASWGVLGASWGRLSGQHGSNLAPKTKPKSIKNRSKNRSKF